MSSSLPEGWRRLVCDDAPAVAEVVAEDEILHGLPGQVSGEDILGWWRRTDLEANSWAREEGGRLVALGWMELYGDDVIGGGVVRPGEKGKGFGAALLDLAERRAGDLDTSMLRQIAPGPDDLARTLLASRGYREVRRHYEMALRLDAEVPEPVLPDGLEVTTFREGEARAFQAAGTEAFAEEWGFHALPFDEWWAMRKDDDKTLWFVVRDGDDLAAIARCEAGHGGGYVGMLGVRQPWRRQGLGRALLLHAFGEFRRRGFERASLGVDSENPTGATRLYESVGMHVESEYVTFEKKLA
jgi:mycothiol synthase